MDQIELLKRWVDRERKARKEAELLLEKKALQLFSVNEKLKALNEQLEQKIVERTTELQDSELRYRQIVETASDIICKVSADGIIKYINPVTESILGYDEKEVVGKNLLDFVHPDYKVSFKDNIRNILKTNFESNYFEFPIKAKSGKTVWVGQNIQAVFNKNGKVQELTVLARNVTERKIAEEKLKRSEEKYRGIIENMELGLLEVDPDHNIQKVYNFFCQMTGYTAEELTGRNAKEVFLSPELFDTMDAHDALRAKGKSSMYETQLRKKDGSLIYVLISGAPIFNTDGVVVGSIGVHYDITQRKKMEMDLAEAKRVAEEAQEAEKQFLARMSHEIRTPLNAIIGMSHLLYDTHPTKEQKEFLSILKSSADLLQALISDILDFSKIQAGEINIFKKEFDLPGLVWSLQKTFQLKLEKKPVEVEAEIDPAINTLLLGDDLLLNQILMNLLGNAAKFTHQGKIIIRVKVLQKENDLIQLQFEVSDTGIGIPPNKVDHIFENFKQADIEVRHKYGGTGLGLAIVKKLIEIQDGKIWVESKPGLGSTFIFQIAYNDSGKSGEITTDKLPELSDLVISCKPFMVAEDNFINRKYISTLLEKWNIPYKMAHNGKEAVKLAQQEAFELIFMDISMPEMDGYEATIAIRNTLNPNQKTPIIALTASAMLDRKNKALHLGMTDFMAKPFKPDALLKTIKKYVSFKGKHEPAPVVKTEKPSFEFSPLLDKNFLEEMFEDDFEYAYSIFETFLHSSLPEFSDLQPLVAKKEWQEARKLAHKLKPAFAMVGLSPVEQKLKELEHMLDTNPDALLAETLLQNIHLDLLESLVVVKQEFERLKTFLQKHKTFL